MGTIKLGFFDCGERQIGKGDGERGREERDRGTEKDTKIET